MPSENVVPLGALTIAGKIALPETAPADIGTEVGKTETGTILGVAAGVTFGGGGRLASTEGAAEPPPPQPAKAPMAKNASGAHKPRSHARHKRGR